MYSRLIVTFWETIKQVFFIETGHECKYLQCNVDFQTWNTVVLFDRSRRLEPKR